MNKLNVETILTDFFFEVVSCDSSHCSKRSKFMILIFLITLKNIIHYIILNAIKS